METDRRLSLRCTYVDPLLIYRVGRYDSNKRPIWLEAAALIGYSLASIVSHFLSNSGLLSSLQSLIQFFIFG